MNRDRLAARLFATASAVTGAAVLARADRVASLAGRPGAVPDPWIVRVLGGRQLVQAVVTFAVPSPTVLVLGAAVDASHAASMVALAGVSPRFRRPALISAGVAGIAVVTGGVLARRASA